MVQVIRATIIVSGLLWLCVAAAQDPQFTARLSTVPIDPRTQAMVTGVGTASAMLSGRELSITGSFEGLQGPANLAQLHLGPITGARGPAILDLAVSNAAEGSLSGTVELTRQQAAALREGRIYIQIHSESAPEGNLWGWLLQ